MIWVHNFNEKAITVSAEMVLTYITHKVPLYKKKRACEALKSGVFSTDTVYVYCGTPKRTKAIEQS